MSYHVCGSIFQFESEAARAVAEAILPDASVIEPDENADEAAEELCRFVEAEASKIGEELGGDPLEGRLPSRASIVSAIALRIRHHWAGGA